MRIASFLTSAAEIVRALGADADLVEVPATEGRPAAGVLAEPRPDLVLAADLCRLCGLPHGQLAAALESLGCPGAEVLELDPQSLDEVFGALSAVGGAVGRQEAAADLAASLRARLDAVAARVAGRARPRVAVLRTIDPPSAAGRWVPELVDVAGGTPVAVPDEPGEDLLTWPAIYAAEPDVVVVAPCGPGLGRALEQALEQARAVLPLLPGVTVVAAQADGFVFRPVPGLATAAEALSRALHAEAWLRDLARPEHDAVARVARA
jgi:iron complex transport system substrate-binding protein